MTVSKYGGGSGRELVQDKKLPGVFYAPWGDIELPILDVTHEAFRVDATGESLEAQAQEHDRQQARSRVLGRLFNRFLLPHLLKTSRIGRGLIAAKDTHLDAQTTYLMKLGSRALGQSFTDLDRRIAGSIAGTLLRVRVQDLAQAQTQAATPLLASSPVRPLHLLNIAGGPASDSINTLLLLHRAAPGLMLGRSIVIHLLDLDQEGPRFAEASLAAWQAGGGPLEGVGAQLEPVSYDWNHSQALATALQEIPRDAALLVSSEGGLFDYGTDQDVLANLSAIHRQSPTDAQVFGTLSRPGGPGNAIRRGSIAAVVLRTVEDLRGLAKSAGWTLAEHWVRPTSSGFRLVKHE